MFDSKDTACEFLQYLNSRRHSIKFTIEFEQDNEIPFLDILVKRCPNNAFMTSIYRKKTFTSLYKTFTGANMAAGRYFRALHNYAILTCIVSSYLVLYTLGHKWSYSESSKGFIRSLHSIAVPFYCNIKRTCHVSSSAFTRRGLSTWTRHGYTSLAAPDMEPTIDITIYMDVSRNPGPESEVLVTRILGTPNSPPSLPRTSLGYSRSALLATRRNSRKVFKRSLLDDLKTAGLLRYRGKRGGRNRRSENRSSECSEIVGNMVQSSKIATVITCKRRTRSLPERGPQTLIRIPKTATTTTRTTHNGYAFPKCAFINICSLTKTKKKVRANVALESDLYAADIDVCVVSETHLRRDVPDANIAITNYNVYKRDRNWFGTDARKKGGVAVYVRNNLKVTEIKRSEMFESICITLDLPSGHKMLICGLYNPPKPIYNEGDLLDYLTDLSDTFLDSFPDGTIVIGGDVNTLDVEELSMLSGLQAFFDFPTRGNSTLDNCLTNNSTLFSKCYPFDAQIKTDHRGVILPPGVKLKPFRYKYTMHDYREHRRIEFHSKLLEQQWDDVESALLCLNSTLSRLMKECFPSKTVRMSTSDPPWMTPLVKTLLRKKAKIQVRKQDGCPVNLRERINSVINENRTALTSDNKIGCKAWWEKVDLLSKRNQSNSLQLEDDFTHQLNEYFGG